MHDCVSVRSKVSSYVSAIPSDCPFCHRDTETLSHLFIDYEITKRLWFALDSNIAGNIGNMNMHEWITSWFQPTGNHSENQVNLITFVGFAIWQIWNLRCNVVFNNAHVQVNNLVSQVNKDVNEWNTNSMRVLAGRNHAGQGRTVTPWSLPENGFQKLNFDAAFMKENMYMGIGLIAFNDAGNCRRAQSIHGIANDEEQAEALAALEAIKWAKAEAVQNLHLEGDCLNVVNAINGSLEFVKWTTNNVIQDCRNLLGSFTNWKCTFVHRESNEVANSLANSLAKIHWSIVFC
ncbi:uncharacterized protein LOC113289986 [Papaver somniferum]|uniref:uncharacterized protein LOC113289986 n=1 Tax=Papaver somniferum TaxID=3469 RepID=UPI000E6FD6CA|nr:uncharacterized protein LOC113289986 [Papaver somniferum]